MNPIRDIKIITTATIVGAFVLLHLMVTAALADSVTVNVLVVTSYGEFDYEESATERDPDFFADLYIDDKPYRTPPIPNEANVAPNWKFTREVYKPADKDRYVVLHLGIGDADDNAHNNHGQLVLAGGPVAEKSEAADINPVAGKTGIDLIFDLEHCYLHSPGRDEAEIVRDTSVADDADACRFQVTGVGDHPMYSASAVFEVIADLSE